MGRILLYHMGFEEIRVPDIRHGRKNADLGQGFYLTADRDFAERWARERRDALPHLNVYELDTDGLRILRFTREPAWFDYISGNRAGRPDAMTEYDVIDAPIANDTLYDTMGILTSGFLSPEQSLALLRLGPEYRQIALKSGQAAARLRWISCAVLGPEQLSASREILRREEEAYQQACAEALERMSAGE